MQSSSMLISFVLSWFNLSYVPLSIYSSGSRFTLFRPCSIQSFIWTILIIDRYRTSLYPDLRNNAGTVSTLLHIPLALPTTPSRTRRLNSHLFLSQEQPIAPGSYTKWSTLRIAAANNSLHLCMCKSPSWTWWRRCPITCDANTGVGARGIRL